MTRFNITYRKAFTLVELLIGLALAGMVFVMISSFMVTLLNSTVKDKRRQAFEQTKNDLHREFSTKVLWAEAVTAETDRFSADGQEFKIIGERIYRDTTPITPENIRVTSFEVQNLSADPEFVSLQINVQMISKTPDLSQDALTSIISQRRLKIVSE
ncbi:MAG: hypothetical protein UX87_C0019G0002 [Candidatus Amesbacteria bacterium GW2011_GWA1_47_16]|uniref:Type II secretion system protein GspI C-terminal domain-containing protein n=4 Tax=Candidatus Amesiibacteriota TaxID=1752730 RepID=A0A1F4ZY33_9BACT|nr:MAG: hypothetical protein UX86_C0030G0015 [Candidatus Amesbacteria bacterium GW2011_GWC1_47_15]KKU63635.1 MAG: hypothetical protein UX87_C0019G0002 [Candidatus Amesbacteria bacterium GW2011_GWA1_47_16]KKU97461.1 MAG: hypothetical protein UY28_C0020G0005 [Candidatus Amesbacteria bacterium GW2011_GWB1_48_13]OGC98107.1 MAG: hypothetical protein A2701_01625 [Candidatus Amesbacteria bacterium RIFCSPHIGHO2_01_FULL_47_34]OGD11241.1 MAG: hypothetical protein A2395_04440 [Candidatus Amesbacteria bact